MKKSLRLLLVFAFLLRSVLPTSATRDPTPELTIFAHDAENVTILVLVKTLGALVILQ